MSSENQLPAASVLVVCLCAEWCGVCRDYVQRFEQVRASFPQARFVWIDVEDEADLLHPLDDVDDFPTLLLAVGDEPRFFGVVMPQLETLERLIRVQTEPAKPALADPALKKLVARIRAAKAVA